MSYRFTYDLDTSSADSDDRTRIRLIFERFAWESTGGTSLTYPAIARQGQPDDLFGQVIPALSLFRSLIAAREINVKPTRGLHMQSRTIGRTAASVMRYCLRRSFSWCLRRSPTAHKLVSQRIGCGKRCRQRSRRCFDLSLSPPIEKAGMGKQWCVREIELITAENLEMSRVAHEPVLDPFRFPCTSEADRPNIS